MALKVTDQTTCTAVRERCLALGSKQKALAMNQHGIRFTWNVAVFDISQNRMSRRSIRRIAQACLEINKSWMLSF